jgi:tRNA (guanine37-N1)-methyltransferase
LKRATNKNLIEFKVLNLRDFTKDKHQTTDQRPFGGGPGMVMMIEPIDRA